MNSHSLRSKLEHLKWVRAVGFFTMAASVTPMAALNYGAFMCSEPVWQAIFSGVIIGVLAVHLHAFRDVGRKIKSTEEDLEVQERIEFLGGAK